MNYKLAYFPCEDCITFSICNIKVATLTYTSVMLHLYPDCSILRGALKNTTNYLSTYEYSPCKVSDFVSEFKNYRKILNESSM